MNRPTKKLNVKWYIILLVNLFTNAIRLFRLSNISHNFGKFLAADLQNSIQVLNLTDIELNRVDIRVGLTGPLVFMDGSPQAVRQLRNLNSQVFLEPLAMFQSFFMLFSLKFRFNFLCFCVMIIFRLFSNTN